MKHTDSRDREPTYDELDVRLDTAFDTLPRERAGDEFTDEVLRRLPANDERFSGDGGLTARSWYVAVAALLLLAVTFGVREWNHRREMRQSIERIAEMRAEYWELERELGELQEKRRAQPVIYLGEVDGTEVVLDLSAFPDARSRLRALGLLRSGVVPAVSGEGDEVLYATDEPEPAFY